MRYFLGRQWAGRNNYGCEQCDAAPSRFEQFFIHGHYNYNSKISYILSDGTLHDFPLNNIITDMEVKDPDTNTLWARCHDFFCWAHFPTETAKKIQKIKLSLEKLPE